MREFICNLWAQCGVICMSEQICGTRGLNSVQCACASGSTCRLNAHKYACASLCGLTRSNAHALVYLKSCGVMRVREQTCNPRAQLSDMRVREVNMHLEVAPRAQPGTVRMR